MRVLLKWVFRLVLGLAGIAGLIAFVWFLVLPRFFMPAAERVDEYVWLPQGWGEGQTAELREQYYYTPQGTSIPQGASAGALRYDWFVHLELPFSKRRFADPEHMRQLRFVVDPLPSPKNPDHLPIGFTRHFDPAIGDYVLDITCAACHTGEIHRTVDKKTVAIRIDGGQAMHAFTDMKPGSFAPLLLGSLIQTAITPWKFDRFAKNVLGKSYPASKAQLRSALHATIAAMLNTGQNLPFRGLYPVREGFGRTDALGRIGNTAFGDHLVKENYQVGDAPVSYPYLWNIWKFDWVQYNGSVAQPLARNIGEALGVGAVSPWRNTIDRPLPIEERFRTSVDIASLQRIEHGLHLLTPPRWPEDVLGTIDTAKAAQGQQLFEQYCRECHGPHISEAARQQATAPLKPSADLEWRIEVIPAKHIGTDPRATKRFVNRRYDLSAIGLTTQEIDAAFRPLLVRALARDARFRLREVVRLRGAERLPLGQLETVLASYPDPDASATATLPTASFQQIDAALQEVVTPLPTIPDARPYDPPGCALKCQTLNLLWDVRNGATYIDTFIAKVDPSAISEGLALNLVGLLIKNKFYRDNAIDYATQQCLEGFGALDLPQQIKGYKPRPLEGVWATPPFLHNGSVPSLYQMLLPPERRDKKFFVGRREFDPNHVGYVSTPADKGDNGFWLDTSEKGNSNAGHAFVADAATWQKHRADYKNNPLPDGVIGPELTDEERFAIVEYLKVHRDPPTPADYRPPQCQLWGQSL